MQKIDPKNLTVATGKDPLRYTLVQGEIEKDSINQFKLMASKIIVDTTKKILEILKNRD